MKWMQFLTPAKSMDFSQTKSYILQHPGEDITILDVRQPSEYKEGHIPGAILIPLPQLSDRINEIDPEKPTLIY
jgi:sulfur-carrier protein adenylyltransferase/sulfurtransferase